LTVGRRRLLPALDADGPAVRGNPRALAGRSRPRRRGGARAALSDQASGGTHEVRPHPAGLGAAPGLRRHAGLAARGHPREPIRAGRSAAPSRRQSGTGWWPVRAAPRWALVASALAACPNEGRSPLPGGRAAAAHLRVDLAQPKCPLLYVAQQGGWKNAGVLLKHYARWMPQALAQPAATSTQPRARESS